MEVNSLRSWLRDYNRALVLKHPRSKNGQYPNRQTASKTIVLHEMLNFQPAMLA